MVDCCARPMRALEERNARRQIRISFILVITRDSPDEKRQLYGLGPAGKQSCILLVWAWPLCRQKAYAQQTKTQAETSFYQTPRAIAGGGIRPSAVDRALFHQQRAKALGIVFRKCHCRLVRRTRYRACHHAPI